MQISDLVGQYNNSTQKPQVTGTTGTKKLASTLKELKTGSIFEGTVNSVKNGQVVLGLSNGQTLTARLEGRIKLNPGQSMFFQVKANESGTIAIRPYTVGGNSVNLTLMDALKAANLMIDERSLAMVDAMMKEQMSIDRTSLMNMVKSVMSHPDVDVKTLVLMNKLEISATPENISQFQNYMTDKRAIGAALDQFMEELPRALAADGLSDREMQQVGREILSIVTEGLPDTVEAGAAVFKSADGVVLALGKEGISGGAQSVTAEGAATGAATGENASAGTGAAENAAGAAGAENAAEAAAAEGASAEGVAAESGAIGTSTEASAAEVTEKEAEGTAGAAAGEAAAEGAPAEAEKNAQAGKAADFLGNAKTVGNGISYTLGNIMARDQIHHLEYLFSEIMPKSESGERTQMTFSPEDSTVAVLNALKERLAGGGTIQKEALAKLFSSEEFQALVKDVLEQQWLLKPEDLKDSNKINRLYEKLENQVERMQDIVKASGQEASAVTQLAQDIRSNVEFMNQLNEAYTYVQIPLKLSGQSASGELFVYTNKKKLAEHAEELSAFLHLDMDNLGSTDVSVKLHGRQVDTKFYLDNDAAYALVMANLEKLDARLAAKGYNSRITVENDRKHMDFVEDFLKKDQPSAGLVHRYSFDVRA